MKYYLILLLFVFTVFFLHVNNKYGFCSDGKTYNDIKYFLNKNDFIQSSNILTINDTFSMGGSLVSIIPPNFTSTYYNKSDTITEGNLTKTITSNDSNNNNTETLSNQSSDISDNLVSLLSGIIIQSINNGNPTINNTSSSPISNLKDNNIKIISGNWKLDVSNGNITNFISNFETITSNGTDIHWYKLNNLKSDEKLFFGNDNSVDLNGKLNFFGNDNSLNETTNVLLIINKLQLIQFIFLDKDIANRFNNYPLYGTIDFINIKH